MVIGPSAAEAAPQIASVPTRPTRYRIAYTPQEPRRTLARPRVQVAPRRRHAGMPERRLNEMDRRAVVERVAGVGVPKPVRRDVGRLPGPRRGRLHDCQPLIQDRIMLAVR